MADTGQLDNNRRQTYKNQRNRAAYLVLLSASDYQQAEVQ